MAADTLNNIKILSQKRQEQVLFQRLSAPDLNNFFPWNRGEKWSFGLLASLQALKESNFFLFCISDEQIPWQITYIDVDKNISVVSSYTQMSCFSSCTEYMEYHSPDAYKTYVNRIIYKYFSDRSP